MKAYGRVGARLNSFFLLPRLRGKWPVLRPGRFTSWEKHPQLIDYESVWSIELVWTLWRGDKSRDHAGNRIAIHWTFCPYPSYYTGYAFGWCSNSRHCVGFSRIQRSHKPAAGSHPVSVPILTSYVLSGILILSSNIITSLPSGLFLPI